MSMITIHGNKSTAPSGTEIFELPFNRIRLLKNDSLGTIRFFSLPRSEKEGMVAVEGIRLIKPCTKPIAGTGPRQGAEQRIKSRDGGDWRQS